MEMNHEELARRIEQRLDRLETKLDSYVEVNTVSKADLAWVKGYIRVSVGAFLALISSMVITIFRVFIVK